MKPQKFEPPDYEATKQKWIEGNEGLSVEEIALLFGMIEAYKARLEAIEKLSKLDR